MARKKERFISAIHPFLKLERKSEQSKHIKQVQTFLNQKTHASDQHPVY